MWERGRGQKKLTTFEAKSRLFALNFVSSAGSEYMNGGAGTVTLQNYETLRNGVT
jgi:hypothetical protein